MLDFIDSCLHGGVTSMISAGEVHLPGRPKDAAGTKALAILAAKSFAGFRPGGVKVRGGAVLLERGLTEADFAEMAAAGVRLVGEIGISTVYTVEEAEPMVRWAQAHGMKVIVHTGGASVPGSNVIGADTVVGLRPDVAAHVNGGPTALPLADLERILDDTDAAVEIVHCGNVAAVAGVAAAVTERDAVDRLLVGTDMPSGTGVVPLGMLRTIAWLACTGRVSPEQAIACATGNTARVHGLDAGIIGAGAAADVLILDAPRGSQAPDALEALRIGDTPSVPVVFVDGEVKVNGSRNTPPPTRAITVPWLAAGGGH
jgi:enamidase